MTLREVKGERSSHGEGRARRTEKIFRIRSGNVSERGGVLGEEI